MAVGGVYIKYEIVLSNYILWSQCVLTDHHLFLNLSDVLFTPCPQQTSLVTMGW